MQLRAFQATQGSTLRRKRLSVQHGATPDAEHAAAGGLVSARSSRVNCRTSWKRAATGDRMCRAEQDCHPGHFFLANAVCWCGDSHPANLSCEEPGSAEARRAVFTKNIASCNPVRHGTCCPPWRQFSTCRELMTLVLMGRTGSPAAACSSPADSATGGSWTNRKSLVSRRIHRLLRVPPTGSSASGVAAC